MASINLKVGGSTTNFYPKSMQKSWLGDVSPPNSICTSMDFQNTDNMLNSLITSGDFSDTSFLLNGNEIETMRKKNELNGTMTIDTNNLMDFTFDVNRTIQVPSDATFTAESEPPMKEYSIENADMTLSESIENLGKNLTFDAHTNGGNITWDEIQDHQNNINQTIVQSTPVHKSEKTALRNKFDQTMSPICMVDDDDEEGVIVRNLKAKKLVNNITADEYRNSMEDQCEFLLNEETIKLSSRFGGETYECLGMKSTLIESADANEKDFDKMLDSFNVTKSLKSASLLQSVDNIKQRHSLINLEKQREEKQRKDCEYEDNKTQYDAMNKSSERLLRRSRLYDDVNLQLQKQQNDTFPSTSAKPELEDEEAVDRNSRDRFKTIKLNKKLQTGMVVVTDDAVIRNGGNDNSTSPGTKKEKRNQFNQLQQETEEVGAKNPVPVSKLSKFGFSRPTYRSRNDLHLPLKASSTDSLDDEPRAHNVPNIKSPMGIKSKSIHNLMFNGTGTHQASRVDSYGNLRLIPGTARSQSNLKTQRTSSLVRPTQEQGFKVVNVNLLVFNCENMFRPPTGSICASLSAIITNEGTHIPQGFISSSVFWLFGKYILRQALRF